MLNRSNLHHYQERAVSHIIEKHKCALFLDLGLGKTITTLTAIEELMYDRFEVGKVLLIAPLRVCNTVWETEANNWQHTKRLKFINLAGGKNNMLTGLQRKADVYLINRENVKALVEHYKGKFPFDMVVIDESSSFKSPSSQRFKALKKVLHKINRMILLTGTPAPNGYMDLWSQIYLLDGGYRLGRTITLFRQMYFESDYMGYKYTIRDGAIKTIQDKIQDLVLSMQSEDYLELPKAVNIVLENKLEGKLLKQYQEFEKHMMLELGDENLTAMTAATLSNKLLQFCSGNVYDENKSVKHFHNLKIDTLKEVIEDNPTENLLVAYNYKHELEALTKAFPDAVVLDKAGKAVKEWNDGKIKLLLAHPASAGHGLNLQKGGSIIIWYGFNWSLELYQQFNARLNRQGQENVVRLIHIAVGDIEYKLMKTLAQKDITQDKLLKALK